MAVNLHMMASNMPLEFMPAHPGLHSRSNSLSSSSSVPGSRPHSSQGGGLLRGSLPPSTEDVYRASYSQLGRSNSIPPDHHRNSSASSFPASDFLATPADSPPNYYHHFAALKGHLRPTHIRARVAASPYPRDTESVHSSSSEAEDMAMFLAPQAIDYNPLYGGPATMQPSQDALSAAGAFGRMTLSPDHALEKLAANVRAATTTSASDRAKQIFVQAWLTANYAPYPDGNVPRQGLYCSYQRVCDQYGIPHINTATLGKAIRLCFPTIKTRRLGVRGNSKYHYCGIRPATSAEAEFLQEFVRKSNNNAAQSSINAARLANEQATSRTEERSDADEDDEDESEGQGSLPGSKRNSLTLNGLKEAPQFADDIGNEKTPTANNLLAQAQASQRPATASFPAIRKHAQPDVGRVSSDSPPIATGAAAPLPYLASQHPLSVRHIPNFPTIEEAVGSDSTSPQGMAAREVWQWFLDHQDTLLDCVRSFRFDQFELGLRAFWSNLTGSYREVVHAPAVAGLMAKADAIVYDEILEILRSQMLSPIPSQSLSSLRQLADKMEKILLAALENYGNTFVEPKVELGARFGHLVLRFLDIYQVTQALNTVLTNQKQLNEMRRSWQKVDFEAVRNQSALVCNCRHEDLVQLLEIEFVALLDSLMKTPEPVREVMGWADRCCERLMGSGRGNPADDRNTMSSRSVLIRWGYVTSQVMRDLTIRSDPSFGAFQILKLFLDDWIAVNVLRSVALSTNSVAASVEPVMQQPYFALSPMAGQENFGANLDVRPTHQTMSHTPTTSSMLAALHDPFPAGTLDPMATTYSADAFAHMYDHSMPSVPQAGLSYQDYVSGPGGSFDASVFTPMTPVVEPGHIVDSGHTSESEHDGEPVKSEPAV